MKNLPVCAEYNYQLLIITVPYLCLPLLQPHLVSFVAPRIPPRPSGVRFALPSALFVAAFLATVLPNFPPAVRRMTAVPLVVFLHARPPVET